MRVNEIEIDNNKDKSIFIDDVNNKTILIVDDERSLLNFMNEVLSSNGFTVFSSISAKEALDIIDKEKIDLLLSDVIMPDMDGYELAKIAREKHPGIKIQLVSGFTGNEKSKFETDVLSKNIIRKPYTIEMLLKKVKEHFVA